jgi:soluble lytic murein transglycosylase-like protein
MKTVWIVLLWTIFSSHAAYADIYSFVDAKGVRHYSNIPNDPRFVNLTNPKTGETKLPNAGKYKSGSPNATWGAMGRSSSTFKNAATLETNPSYLSVKYYMQTAAQENQIDLALLKAIIATESAFNTNAVSPKGARGLMQVMPATAQRFGVSDDHSGSIASKLADPQTNIAAGTRYLRYLFNLFPNDLELVIASYNAGEGAVKRYGNRIPDYPETQNYVRSVMQLYQQFSVNGKS